MPKKYGNLGDSGSDGSGDDEAKEVHLFEPGDTRIPMEASSYDGVVLALTCLLDESYEDHHGFLVSFMQFLFAMFLHILTIGSQFAMVFLLLTTTVQSSAVSYRSNIANRTEIIHNSVQSGVELPESDDALAFCHKDKTRHNVHFFILIIWGARMMNEAVQGLWRLTLVFRLQHESENGDLISEDVDSGKIVVYKNNCIIKVSQIVLVVIPQLTIAFLLWYTGAKYLTFANTMGTVILKAIGLSFIVTIDELLFKAFASMRFKVRLARSVFMYRQERPNWHWSMWGTSCLKFLIVLCSAIWIVFFIFPDVRQYRVNCHQYRDMYQVSGMGYTEEEGLHELLHAMDII